MIVRGNSDGPEAARRIALRGGRDGRSVVTVEGATEEPQHRGPPARRQSQFVDGGDQALIGGLIHPRPSGRCRWPARDPLGYNARTQDGHRGEACGDPNCVMSRPHTRTLSYSAQASR